MKRLTDGGGYLGADDVGSIYNNINIWRAAARDTAIFEKTTTAPATPVEEIIPQQAELLGQLG